MVAYPSPPQHIMEQPPVRSTSTVTVLATAIILVEENIIIIKNKCTQNTTKKY
jgi:hypothetical protein